MAIWEHIRNITPYRLYANDSPEGPLTNRDSGIAKVILWVKRMNIKNFFCLKIYENSLEDQWPFGNI